ncbi:MAG: 1-acyl-sn-glycerol-3-phosphate acyltransferase [Aeromicrobium sp.]
MKRLLVRLALAISRYKMVGTTSERVGVFVGAPHTSNWDFVVAVMVMWHNGLPLRVLVKDDLFKGPLAWILRAFGGIAIDRNNAVGIVDGLVAEAADAHKPFVLVVAAEGTRKQGTYWKSGFYRIAEQASLPIILGFVDHDTRTMGVGPTLRPTGDVRADMDVVRAFYADKGGIKPALRTVPRLREEGERPVA